MFDPVTLDEVVRLTNQLSLLDKVRLLVRLTPDIERGSNMAGSISKRSLWGICADFGSAPSSEEIDQVRRDVWADFPREDI